MNIRGVKREGSSRGNGKLCKREQVLYRASEEKREKEKELRGEQLGVEGLKGQCHEIRSPARGIKIGLG